MITYATTPTPSLAATACYAGPEIIIIMIITLIMVIIW